MLHCLAWLLHYWPYFKWYTMLHPTLSINVDPSFPLLYTVIAFVPCPLSIYYQLISLPWSGVGGDMNPLGSSLVQSFDNWAFNYYFKGNILIPTYKSKVGWFSLSLFVTAWTYFLSSIDDFSWDLLCGFVSLWNAIEVLIINVNSSVNTEWVFINYSLS